MSGLRLLAASGNDTAWEALVHSSIDAVHGRVWWPPCIPCICGRLSVPSGGGNRRCAMPLWKTLRVMAVGAMRWPKKVRTTMEASSKKGGARKPASPCGKFYRNKAISIGSRPFWAVWQPPVLVFVVDERQHVRLATFAVSGELSKVNQIG